MRKASLLTVIALMTTVPTLKGDHHLSSVDLDGVWKVAASTDDGPTKLTWTFTSDGSELSGESRNDDSGTVRKIDRIEVDAKKVQLEIDIEQDGNTGIIRVDVAQEQPGRLTGKWAILGSDGVEYMAGDVRAVKVVEFAGNWDSTATLPDGTTLESVLTLSGRNSVLTATFESDNGAIEVGEVNADGDNSLTLEFKFDMNGREIHCVIEGQAIGSNRINGLWKVLDDDGVAASEGEWSAVRQVPSLAGTWDVVATVPDDGDHNGTMTLELKEGAYTGTSEADDGKTESLKDITFSDNKLTFTVPVEQDVITGQVRVVAGLESNDTLLGEWILSGPDDQELMRGAWKATRR